MPPDPMELLRQRQAGKLRQMKARSAFGIVEKKAAVDLKQATRIAAEAAAAKTAEIQAVKVAGLQRKARKLLPRSFVGGESQAGFQQYVAMIRTYPEGYGGIVADNLEKQSERLRSVEVREKLATVEKWYLRRGIDPPENLAELVGKAVGEGSEGKKHIRRMMSKHQDAAALGKVQSEMVRKLEALVGRGAKGTQGTLEAALAEVGEARTPQQVRAVKAKATPGLEKAAARGRMGKAGIMGGLAALIGLPMFKHFMGKDEAPSEMTPQQQFQLAMAMAQRGGTDESSEAGRQLMNTQRMLRIMQMLQQFQGTQLQPQAGIV